MSLHPIFEEVLQPLAPPKRTVAVLFADPKGQYAGLKGVDLWCENRDARTYAGPHPVVAHPPCARWCQLAYIIQKRYGHKVGDDGDCFASALASVRHWGGVLEHPAFSYAWPAFSLPKPERGCWKRDMHDGGWVTEVSQGAYGHRARKLTWLYYHGSVMPPPLKWRVPVPTAQVSFCANHGDSPLPRLSSKEASSTPPEFRDLLLSIAHLSDQTPPYQGNL